MGLLALRGIINFISSKMFHHDESSMISGTMQFTFIQMVQCDPHSLLAYCWIYTPADTIRWINVGLRLVHRCRRWTNVKQTLIQRLWSAGTSHPQFHPFYSEASMRNCETGALDPSSILSEIIPSWDDGHHRWMRSWHIYVFHYSLAIHLLWHIMSL